MRVDGLNRVRVVLVVGAAVLGCRGEDGAASTPAAREAKIVEPTPPASRSDADPLIEALFDVTTAGSATTQLEAMGPKAVPLLLRALKDPRTKTVRYPKRPRHLPQFPLELICDLLGRQAPLQDISALAPFLEHEDPAFTEAAAELAAVSATEAAAPLVVRALADERDYVVLATVTGMFVAHRAGRVTPAFRDAVAPELVRLAGADHMESTSAIRLLVRLDEARARATLLTPERLDPKRSDRGWIVSAFNEQGLEIPRERLEPLLDPSQPHVYGEALMALAIIGDNAAKATLQAALASDDAPIRLAAARALARSQGVVEPMLTLYARIEDVGFDALSDAQRRYFAVSAYNGEVNNGGHSQYFFNSAGDHWPEALAGLTALGATTKAEILRAVVDRLGEDNLVADRGERNRRLARVLDGEGVPPGDDAWAQLAEIGKRLDALDTRFYKDTDNLELRLALHVLEHTAEFRAD